MKTIPRKQAAAICHVCNRVKNNGNGKYDLRKCSGYEIFVCDSCFEGNWDGWGLHCEPRILAILEEKGLLPPKRNAKGWLPREFPPDGRSA